MSYTVKQLAKIAQISVRTLHHYDQIGLLSPMRAKSNSYRLYGESDLLRLQQILFFRELEFPLPEIKAILSSPTFSIEDGLKDQRKLLLIKKKRLDDLVETIDKTIKNIKKQKTMKDEELYGAFTKEEQEKYAAEAKERWGHTDAWKQSEEQVKKMGPEGLKKAGEEGAKISAKIAEAMKEGVAPKSELVQKLIAEHYNWLRNFYEPGPEMYKGLANMYVEDERFTKNIDKQGPGLAAYMREAMIYFADNMMK